MIPFPPPDAADSIDPPDLSDPERPDSPDGPDNEWLFGISFDGPIKAQEFLLAMTRLASEGHLRLKDAAIVAKDEDGRVRIRETADVQPGQAALSGALWSSLVGLLIAGPVGWIAGLGVGAGAGAIAAKVIDVGIPDEWLGWFEAAVRPETATVVALASEIDLPKLMDEARRFSGAELVHTTMRPGATAQLVEALSDSLH